MSEITQRSIFIHIDLPGQENDATLFEGPYPSIQELGENLIPRVLDDLKVPICVCVGEGAGKCVSHSSYLIAQRSSNFEFILEH